MHRKKTDSSTSHLRCCAQNDTPIPLPTAPTVSPFPFPSVHKFHKFPPPPTFFMWILKKVEFYAFFGLILWDFLFTIVGLRGFEPKQPLSSPFCCFLPYLPCLASARRRHLRQKSIKNYFLRGAWQFSAICVFQDKENHADNTLCIIKCFSAVLGNADA